MDYFWKKEQSSHDSFSHSCGLFSFLSSNLVGDYLQTDNKFSNILILLQVASVHRPTLQMLLQMRK
jgi:hypothetical protein